MHSNLTNNARAYVAIVAFGVIAALASVWGATAAHAQFGIKAFDQQILAEGGAMYTQAGGHPYEISTEIDFNSHKVEYGGGEPDKPDEDPKDIITELPPGLVGNPTAVAQCEERLLVVGLIESGCPVDSQVGTITLRVLQSLPGLSFTYPVYNMVPHTGQPATFGFNAASVAVTISGNVRNGGDSGVNVFATNAPTTLPLDGFTLTFWGNPADPSHDAQRCDFSGFGLFDLGSGPVCPFERGTKFGPNSYTGTPEAFLTMPSSCTPAGVGLATNLKTDSWQHPGVFSEQLIYSHLAPGWPEPPSAWGAQQGTTGCENVPFRPGIGVEPTNHQADTPSGLNIDISVPQEGLINPAGVATADVKDAVVTLPAGESVSPSAADGLVGCTPTQIGLGSAAPASCPDASKLGTVDIKTPLLKDPLGGSIFLGSPECGPCGEADDLAGRLLKLYVVVEGQGVILKLPGRVELDPHTGRIKATFLNNPQLPFDDLKLNFKAGPRSPLVNPPFCGTYTTQAEFTPWSGNPPAQTSSSFQITAGPEGGPCPASPQSFGPGFVAGTTSNQAGGFSPMSVMFTRADGEQQLGGIKMTLPGGLLGSLAAVPLCGEPQAAQGTCQPSSEIGSLTVAAGAGANPFYVRGGKVFVTGPYNDAPFGLSVVVPAKAGPLDLGTVVVRGTINVDPHTAALTVATEALPTILDGIPLDLRAVNVSIDRPGFIFNPTNCTPLSIDGVLTGGLGSVLPVSSRFQASNCGNLSFKPKFTVSTSGRTSRANGASLQVRVVYPKGSFGKQANIAKVKVDLPKQLPSRLTTLQKACPAQVFSANPAGCGPGSIVGHAVVHTQLLPVPIEGPAYFVSHGGEEFPNLIVVLQGDGVTVDLVSKTFIKNGVTSSTFSSTPDVPFEDFELVLPQGKYSALAANGNLCGKTVTTKKRVKFGKNGHVLTRTVRKTVRPRLVMPTIFVAQNGAGIHQNTPISVTGCGKPGTASSRKAK